MQNFQRGNIIRKMLANSSTNKIRPCRRPNLNWESLCVSSKNPTLGGSVRAVQERFVRRSGPRLNYTNRFTSGCITGSARKCIRTLTDYLTLWLGTLIKTNWIEVNWITLRRPDYYCYYYYLCYLLPSYRVFTIIYLDTSRVSRARS